MTMDLLELKAKPISTIAGKGGIVAFRRNLRSAIRGLWTGAITKRQALSTFRSAIEWIYKERGNPNLRYFKIRSW